ncbi:putative Phage portal protein, HK97 family [Candidatus Desulfosporosinus infrequens]|uniref:Putative Phage portal protein, HK97 family n=1 Tax=Candidatus Desulfosporosinus infrequens TaxID=2043169 RepID=A0A2U3LGV8_9FIRM|nr:putative Phage portal protein, HK97 family [Candidatus Desulfosporosinus infrequens]
MIKEIRSMFSGMFPKKTQPQQQQSPPVFGQFRTLNGYLPVASNTNGSIYYNYLMRMCLRAIATHVAKADVKHIRYVTSTRADGSTATDTIPQNSNIANLLSGQPNPYMNSSEFLFKLTTNLLIHNNGWVYLKEDENPGPSMGNTLGFYPLNSSFVTYMESKEVITDDETGNLFVKFNFRGGEEIIVPYEQIIHIKRDYFENDLMGSYNDQAIRPLTELVNTVHNGIIKAVENAPANIRGSLKFPGVLKVSDLKAKANELLSKFFDINNNGGIIVTDDSMGEFKPIDGKAVLLDAPQMEAIQRQVFGYYNVNAKFVFSEYNESEFNAVFNSVISPILKQYSEAFTYKVFTDRQRGFGNKIIFTANRIEHTSDLTKTQILQYAGPLGIFSINEYRELFGYAPQVGGERTVESLNFVDVNIKNDYQLNMSKTAKQPPAPNNDDGKTKEPIVDENGGGEGAKE